MAELEEVQWIKRIAEGDSKSFELLLQKHKSKVFGFCVRMIGDRAMAEDLAQETWIRVVENAGRFQPQAKVSTWIITIARNLALNHLKKRKWEVNVGDDELAAVQDPSEDMERLLSRQSDTQRVVAAMQLLSEQSRVVLTLWLTDDLNQSQIAEQLGLSVNHVKVLLHRARKFLEEELGGIK